jgi:hypothetical protein
LDTIVAAMNFDIALAMSQEFMAEMQALRLKHQPDAVIETETFTGTFCITMSMWEKTTPRSYTNSVKAIVMRRTVPYIQVQLEYPPGCMMAGAPLGYARATTLTIHPRSLSKSRGTLDVQGGGWFDVSVGYVRGVKAALEAVGFY